MDELDGDTIKLTEFSLTSVHLIQYLLKDHNINFVTKSDDHCCGELLIADDAIRRYYQKTDPYVYDLSELWKTKTGLPFVFALWVARQDVYNRNKNEVRQIFRSLLYSREKSVDLFEQMAKEKFSGIFPTAIECEEYLKNIHYDLSEDYQKGFLLFQKKLIELGKLNQVAPIYFID